MNVARRLVPLIAAALITTAGFAAPAAYAGPGIPGTVSGQASDLTPSVPGGYCYATADQSLCRRVLVLKQAGDWIYAGGIISTVTDRITGVTTSGFHNIFRFSASTHRVDTSWKPQFYSAAQTGGSAYKDSAVTGLATDEAGTLYVSGSFSKFAPAPGAAGVARRGVAAINGFGDGSLKSFNPQVCTGGGGCIVNDVEYVHGTVWLGGNFSHLAGSAVTALAVVNAATGALTGGQLGISGVVTPNVTTKVAQLAINPQQTQAAMIGNFASVGGVAHKEVAILDITGSGGAAVNSWNDPTNLNASNSTNCSSKDTWARGVDWDPTGTFFDIAASGGGGFDAFGAHGALCDAFTRFKSDGNASTPHPLIVNVTGFDSLFTVVDTGDVAYTGGHNKSLNHAVYINGAKVKASQENHYGIGAIDVNPSDAGYGRAVTSFNNSTATGRGQGWAASLSTSAGVYIGGDAQVVGSDTTIKRLAFFPAGG